MFFVGGDGGFCFVYFPWVLFLSLIFTSGLGFCCSETVIATRLVIAVYSVSSIYVSSHQIILSPTLINLPWIKEKTRL